MRPQTTAQRCDVAAQHTVRQRCRPHDNFLLHFFWQNTLLYICGRSTHGTSRLECPQRHCNTVLSGHSGHGPSWQLILQKCLSPAGPHDSGFAQMLPHSGIGSVQLLRESLANLVFPQGQVVTYCGSSAQGWQGGAWHGARHTCAPHASTRAHASPHDHSTAPPHSAVHATERAFAAGQ